MIGSGVSPPTVVWRSPTMRGTLSCRGLSRGTVIVQNVSATLLSSRVRVSRHLIGLVVSGPHEGLARP